MEKKANYREGKVTQKLFEAVKICLESGNSVNQTAQFMKLTKSVVAIIRDSETYEEYKAEMWKRSQACHAKRKAKLAEEKREEEKAHTIEEPKKDTEKPSAPVETRTTVTIQASKFADDKLSEAVDLLKTISAKLAVIIDDLYGTGKTGT